MTIIMVTLMINYCVAIANNASTTVLSIIDLEQPMSTTTTPQAKFNSNESSKQTALHQWVAALNRITLWQQRA